MSGFNMWGVRFFNILALALLVAGLIELLASVVSRQPRQLQPGDVYIIDDSNAIINQTLDEDKRIEKRYKRTKWWKYRGYL